MILWAMVMLSALTSGLNLATLDANAEVRALGAEIYKRNGLNRTAPIGCLITLASLANIGLWIAYAIDVNDWRFAAIPGLPWLIAMIAYPLHNRTRKARK
jgi:hypothetical protein